MKLHYFVEVSDPFIKYDLFLFLPVLFCETQKECNTVFWPLEAVLSTCYTEEKMAINRATFQSKYLPGWNEFIHVIEDWGQPML